MMYRQERSRSPKQRGTHQHSKSANAPKTESPMGWFRVEQDVGCYQWSPQNGVAESRKHDERTIMAQLRLERNTPPSFKAHVALPVVLKKNLNYMMKSRFPFDMPVIVHAVVAARRGVDLNQIDFVLGGSALGFLAAGKKENNRKVMCAQRLGRVIFIKNIHDFSANLGDTGPQIERALVGHRIDDCKASIGSSHHLQVVHIGEHRVVISAEVDCWHAGAPAEIKASKKSGGVNTLLQMFSSGSKHLVKAHVEGDSITRIDVAPRDQIVDNFNADDLRVKGDQVVRALTSLRVQFAGDGDQSSVLELSFANGNLVCKPCAKSALQWDLLPSSKVAARMADLEGIWH